MSASYPSNPSPNQWGEGKNGLWRMAPRLALTVLTLLASTIAFGQASLSTHIDAPTPPAGGWIRGRKNLPQVEVPPKIDGELDDACWKVALHGNGFYRFLSTDPVADQTEVWMCADKEKLYVAFHCQERDPNGVVAKETQRNGNLNQDDRVVILIDSQSTKRNTSAFWVNARGTQLQEMEGGTADNQAWQGDWSAATKKVADGWTVEMAIPFKLLRYPKGTRSFGMFVARKKPMESNFTCWPYMPPQSDTGSIAQYLTDFDGINPPYYAPKPTVLPYTLATAGQANTARFGLDVKYPISTTLTGVATINPDFQTVEGAVQDLSFSYTEKYVPDRRPFFAEGGDFLSDSFLFYSQRIPNVDYGLKVTGKQGPATVGLLTTASHTGDKQQAEVATFDYDIGTYSGFGGTFLDNRQTGNAGQVTQLRGQYGWSKGMRNVILGGNMTQSKLGDGRKGESDFLLLRSYAGKGYLNGNIYYTRTSADFDNPLGLVSEVDSQGFGFNLNTFDVIDKGPLESRSYYLGGESFNHTNGTFFHNSLSFGAEFDLRNGFAYGVNGNIGRREEFRDRTYNAFLSWNQKSLFSRGGVSVDTGRRENKRYQYVSVDQGVPLGKKFSMNLTLGQLLLGTEAQNQAILSGTYRIDPLQSLGGRLVAQGGKANVYFSYGHRTRKGNDLFILFGDPNSPATKNSISLKIVWSL